MDIVVNLYKDRSKEGVLSVFDESILKNTFRCLGESDLPTATAHNNPTRDPLKPYGNIPTGIYTPSVVHAALVSESSLRSYGPGPIFLLTPVSGDGFLSKRIGLAIHGGPAGAPMPPNALRPTYGCIRVDDSTIRVLITLMHYFAHVTVQETLGIPT